MYQFTLVWYEVIFIIRTFIAVDLPDSFRDTITAIQQDFRGNAKIVKPEQVHITLKFLGDVPEESIPRIGDAISGLECEPFVAEAKGVGAFPKPSYARVVYIGASPEEAFVRLHADVESKLKPLGFKSEKRAFTPHATLARVKQISKSQRIELADTIERLKDVEIGTMGVDMIKLKKSTLTPAGAIYETLREVHL